MRELVAADGCLGAYPRPRLDEVPYEVLAYVCALERTLEQARDYCSRPPGTCLPCDSRPTCEEDA